MTGKRHAQGFRLPVRVIHRGPLLRVSISEGICLTLEALLQAIDEKGYQQELPDIWLSNGNPWEIPRPDITFKIGFYGSVDNFKWSPGETVCLQLMMCRAILPAPYHTVHSTCNADVWRLKLQPCWSAGFVARHVVARR